MQYFDSRLINFLYQLFIWNLTTFFWLTCQDVEVVLPWVQWGPPHPSQQLLTVLFTARLSISGDLREEQRHVETTLWTSQTVVEFTSTAQKIISCGWYFLIANLRRNFFFFWFGIFVTMKCVRSSKKDNLNEYNNKKIPLTIVVTCCFLHEMQHCLNLETWRLLEHV